MLPKMDKQTLSNSHDKAHGDLSDYSKSHRKLSKTTRHNLMIATI